MVKTTHFIEATGRCPIDNATDRYRIVVIVEDRVLPVEDILTEIKMLLAKPIFQENLTMHLAKALKVKVITECTHSGVYTICEA